jgi:hypothetical protein
MNVRSQDNSPLTEQNIYVFNNVNVNFILLVLDALCSPRYSSCCSHCNLLQLFKVSELCLRSLFSTFDVLFQQVCIQQLGISEVHHLI